MFDLDNFEAPLARTWNGIAIQKRWTDGFLNATAMCKANGKRWSDYRETDRCQRYLDALSELTGNPVVSLYHTTEGRNGGTYVHPQVAIDLARWISPEFAVWMDVWFIESSKAPAAPAEPEPKQLPAAGMIELVERSISLFDRLGGLDERDQLLFKDIVRSNVLSASSGSMQALAPAPEDEEMALSDAWMEVTGTHLTRKQGSNVGRLVAAYYREAFQEDPPTRTQFVDGAPRKVNSYKRSWLLEAVRSIAPLHQR